MSAGTTYYNANSFNYVSLISKVTNQFFKGQGYLKEEKNSLLNTVPLLVKTNTM